MLQALRFFGFLNTENVPTDLLGQYRSALPYDKQAYWRTILERRYSTGAIQAMAQGDRDPARHVLAERWGITSQHQVRCLSFLVRAMEKANLSTPRQSSPRRPSVHTTTPALPKPVASPPIETPPRMIHLTWGSVALTMKENPSPHESQQIIHLLGLLLEWVTEETQQASG